MIKKTVLFIIVIAFFNCTSNEVAENCLRPFSISISTDLNNPQLINAQVPGGFTELPGGSKGILLININGNDFIAYDKICPNNDCASPMTYENGLVLKCGCDESEYGVGPNIGGAPQTPGFECSAIEYKVTKNGSAIRISNF
jgi:hypothetical protein